MVEQYIKQSLPVMDCEHLQHAKSQSLRGRMYTDEVKCSAAPASRIYNHQHAGFLQV